MKSINLGPHLWIPTELAARTQAILAQKGAGKTYAAMKETEKLMEFGSQVVCLDPTGVWWGLRSSADGKDEGFPIIIMGGDKADVPLEPSAGDVIAEFVQASGQSVILDMSHFESNAAQDRFVTDFATRLYRLKATAANRNTIHLMLDEADSFIPQRPGKSQLKMLGAWEAIVRRGRSRGLGLTMITQRPAVLNKNVLTQVDLLVCLRIVGKQDFDAVKEWTAMYATAEQKAEFLTSLPQLKNGEAWFWSPGWLRIFRQTMIDKKWTFDSSRTPEPGEAARVPKKVAPVDLANLSDQIKATVEAKKANDPAALKKLVREHERTLADCHFHEIAVELDLPHDSYVPDKILGAIKFLKQEKTVEEKPILTEKDFDRLQKVHSQLENELMLFREKLSQVKPDDSFKSDTQSRGFPNYFREDIPTKKERRPVVRPRPTTPAPGQLAAAGGARVIETYTPASQSKSGFPEVRGTVLSDRAISPVMQRILDGLAELEQLGADTPAKELVAFMAGYSNLSSKGFANAIGALRSLGMIDYPRPGVIYMTPTGAKIANPAEAPRTPKEVQARICTMLGGASARILQPLIENYPMAITREQVAEAAGYGNLASKGFANAIGRLRSLGFIDYPERGMVKAMPVLFLES